MAESTTNFEDLKPSIKQALAITGGIALAYELIRHRHLVLTAIAAGGGAMLAKHYLDQMKSRNQDASRTHLDRDAGTPSYPGEAIHRAQQTPADEVEEASMESFPASDPPGSYHRA